VKFLNLSEDSVSLKLFQLRSELGESFRYSTESENLIYSTLTSGGEGKVVAAALILSDGLPQHRALAEDTIRDFCANAQECDRPSLFLAMEALQMYPPDVLKQPEYQRLITIFLEFSAETSEGRMARHLQARSEGRPGSVEDLAEFPQEPWWSRLLRPMTGVWSRRGQ
jgi:hypothetical protein